MNNGNLVDNEGGNIKVERRLSDGSTSKAVKKMQSKFKKIYA